jgi:tripartite-type tricarboxylate transporter receptor subunit TctC
MNRRAGPRFARAFLLASALIAPACQATRQPLTVEQTFSGQTIRLVVAFAAGGGYDIQARLLADHLGRHLPGGPAVVVENMPGAGGLVAASHIDRQAPDGLTLGLLGAAPVAAQLLSQSTVEFDVGRWSVIGGATRELDDVCIAAAGSGLTLDSWRARTSALRAGTSGRGSTSHIRAAYLAAALRLPLRFVTGYRGTADMRLALEGGEIDVLCVGLSSYRATMEPLGGYVPILQSRSEPALTAQGVPSADALVSDPQGRSLLALLATLNTIDRYYVAPPGMRQDVIDALRQGFEATLRDAAFLSAARNARSDAEYVAPAEIEAGISSVRALPNDVREMAVRLFAGDTSTQ